MLAFSRATGKLLWSTKVPVERRRAHVPEEQPRVGDADDRRPARLRVVRHARPRRVRLRRQARCGTRSSATSTTITAARARRCSTRTALFLYQDHDGTATLRSFVAAFDAATGKVIWKTRSRRDRRLGHADRHQHRHARRADRQQPAARLRATIPRPGQELWSVRGNTFEVIPTPVVGHGLVFCSSGRAGPDVRDQARRAGRRHRHARRLVIAARDRRSCRRA